MSKDNTTRLATFMAMLPFDYRENDRARLGYVREG